MARRENPMKLQLNRHYTNSALMLVLVVVGLMAIATPANSAGLPPRPKPQPIIVGAYIKLIMEMAPAGAWTMVQWQNNLGGWHDVEGWQGTLDDTISILWWVAPRDYDTGPFRWPIFDTDELDETLGISDSFDPPESDRELVEVEIRIEQ